MREGFIAGVGPELAAGEKDDASRMIVVPGLVNSHYHMWSTIGRNFLSDRDSNITRQNGRQPSTTVRIAFITV